MQVEIPGFRLVDKIYQSSRSLVYRAVREEDGTPVVIKTLNEEYPTPQSVSLFQKEFELTRRLEIKGVVNAIEMKRVGNTMGIVLEDTGGSSLALGLSYPLSLDLFFKIAAEVARTLGAIHEAHIIHKDINPSNIIWNPESETVNIIDFGISTELLEETFEITDSLRGSPPYISPEQTGRMNRSVDYRTDYYSLGVTFYELVTGELPFHAEDTMGWVHAHISRMPTPPKIMAPDIPETLSDMILKLMSKNAEDRYQSSRGFMLDLDKCKQQWLEGIEDTSFELGQWDVSETFQMPQKLYGRDEEITTLMNAFDEVAQGHTALMLVAGYAGVGKSALINEVHKPIVSRHGYFIEGKFDQFQQNVPYSAVAQAFRGLMRQILSDPPDILGHWRTELLTAFGPNGQVLIDLVPELERIVGAQPPAQPINPAEAHNRFLLLFRNFIKVFAHPDHPLVVFLDDLQWADAASLTLIESIVTDREISSLFLIGAYRNNEVGVGHILMLSLDEIQKNKPIYRLFLKPLSQTAVNEAISETLHCTTDRSQALAETVYQKTEGNPFFVREVLKNMHREGMLRFLHDEGRWSWEPSDVEAVAASENVVRFMINRLRKLPQDTINALRLAACIGNKFDLRTLSVILESTPFNVASSLWDAVQQGIIVPLDDGFRLFHQYRNSDNSLDFDASYKFQHDQVQQAAYALTEETRRKETHLQIGRLMLRRFRRTQAVSGDRTFMDIVHHLNQGFDLIEEDWEREELAQFNLKAGSMAMASSAYQAALGYFSSGISLLPANAWQTHYSLSFGLYKSCAWCSYLCKDFNNAEELSKTVMQHARTNPEKAEIHRIHLLQYAVLGKFEEAIKAGLEGLALLDVVLANRPRSMVVLKENLMTKWALARKEVDELENLPPMIDANTLIAMRILAELIPPAYLTGNAKLMAITVLKMVNLSLKYGNAPESATGFVTYGAVLGGLLGDLKAAARFGRLGLKLEDHFKSLESRCRTYFLYGLFIHSWNEHWKTLAPIFREAMEAGYQAGDLMYTGYASLQLSLWNPEQNLKTAIETGRKYLPSVRNMKNQEAWYLAKLSHQFHLNLRGLTNDLATLNDASFDEAQCLVMMTRSRFQTGLALFYIVKMQIYFHQGRFNAAATQMREADKVATALFGQPRTVEFCLFSFLTLSQAFLNLKQREKGNTLKLMRKKLRKMKKWAEHCPANFLHCQYLMEAELYAVTDRPVKRYYDRAIEAASAAGFIRHEALANELAARFYYRRGQDKIGAVYLREAHYLYGRWGAVTVVRDLEEKNPWLLQRHENQEAEEDDKDTTVTTHRSLTDSKSSSLDFSAVTKAAQTLTDEVVLEKLLVKLMDIVRENAGAERAVLLLRDAHSHDLLIQAESIEEQDVRIMQSETIQDHGRVCPGVVQFVVRTREPVVLDDAAGESDFTMDPYILDQKPKSLLAMPINKSGKLIGILYMENNVATNVFTEDRLEVLNIIAAKAAVSIENAQLYHQLEQRVLERTAQLETAQRELIEAAHHSGMAEIATGILHNVGNILNSINTSTDVSLNIISKSRLPSLVRANNLLDVNRNQIAQFIENDPKGKQLPTFYIKLGHLLEVEQDKLKAEFEKIQDCANLIKDVIGAQQEYARAGLYTVEVDIATIIDDTITFQMSRFEKAKVKVTKEYEKAPPLKIQKSKFIHILTNLFKNAVEASAEKPPEERVIHVKVSWDPEEATYIKVKDNGSGIPKDQLNRIFTHGFTTKKGGHGFGLHTCANYMTEMGGHLIAHSDGPGQGAVFTLIFPTSEETDS